MNIKSYGLILLLVVVWMQCFNVDIVSMFLGDVLRKSEGGMQEDEEECFGIFASLRMSSEQLEGEVGVSHYRAALLPDCPVDLS